MAPFNSETARIAGLKGGRARASSGSQVEGNDGAAYIDPRTAAAAAAPAAEPEQRAKRRDGAPPTGGDANLGDSGAPKRGRPAKEKGASLDLSALAGALQGVHVIIAMQRNEPHWMLNDDDAKRYGTALGAALRHMPIKAAQKTIDYASLAIVAFAIETPRIGRSIQLARAPKPASRGPAQVFQFVSPSPSPANPPPAASSSPTEPPSPGIMPEGILSQGPADYGGEMGGEIS
jgi:hypothetical protein